MAKKGTGLLRRLIADIKRTGSKSETARRSGIAPSTLRNWEKSGIPSRSLDRAREAVERLSRAKPVDYIKAEVDKRGLSSVARDLGFSPATVKNTLKHGVLPERKAEVWENALDRYRAEQHITRQDLKGIKADLRTLDKIPGAFDSFAQSIGITSRKLGGWFEKVKSGKASDEILRTLRDALESSREGLEPSKQGIRYLKDPRTGKPIRESYRWADYQAPVLPHALPKADAYVIYGVDKDGKVICSTYANDDLSDALSVARKKFKHYPVASYAFHLMYFAKR
jgi:DNA-binding transcriptional MerR regulator